MMKMENPTLPQTMSGSLSSRDVAYATSKKFSHWSCFQCGVASTPVRRSGPYGQSTLCNACGLRLSKLKKMYNGVLDTSNYQKHWERLQKRAKLSRNKQKRAAKPTPCDDITLLGVAIDMTDITQYPEQPPIPTQDCLYWNNEKPNEVRNVLLPTPPHRPPPIQDQESTRFASFQFPNSTLSVEHYPNLYEDYTPDNVYTLPTFEDVNSQLEEQFIPADFFDPPLEFNYLDGNAFPNYRESEDVFDLEKRQWNSRFQMV